MYFTLGYLSTCLLIILLLPYVLRILNKQVLRNNKNISNIIKLLKKYHKVSGILFAIIAIIHGYMKLGSIKLHTGSLLYISALITIIFGILFSIKKKKKFLKFHKIFVSITIAFWLVHILFPSALFYIFKYSSLTLK